MDRVIKKCDKCGEIWSCDPRASIHGADDCNGNFIETSLSYEDFCILCDISSDNDFLQAMIDLKEKDIIEYNLKMSQFRTQVKQQKSSKIKNDNRPKCPTCQSTNIKKIGTGERAVSVATFGLFSKKINKSFKCNGCGYTW